MRWTAPATCSTAARPRSSAARTRSSATSSPRWCWGSRNRSSQLPFQSRSRMDFSFTEEQSMLRDTVASYLADNYTFDQRKTSLAKEPGWSPQVWKAFAEELGILGAPFPEELGGLGGGHIENMIVMEEFGK